MLLGQQ